MDKTAAMASLGLSGNEDPATVARIYGQRLSVVQEKLATAQSDAGRSECQTQISQLVEAYELMTGTGRYTKTRLADPATADLAATAMRAPEQVGLSKSSTTALVWTIRVDAWLSNPVSRRQPTI